MKKPLILLLTLFLIIPLIFLFKQKNNTIPSSVPTGTKNMAITNTPIPLENKNIMDAINIKTDEYNLVLKFKEIPKTSNVILIPNFAKKEFGQKIASDNSCSYAVNGGFYKENDTPLGLFSIGNLSLGTYQQSSIATGFFWQNQNKEREIGKNAPKNTENADFIMQAGPYLQPGNYKLKMITDEKARRSLLFTDKNDKLYISTIYDPNDNYFGPLLSDLPQILSSPVVQNKVSISNFLNLDGGSASFFYIKDKNEEFSLSEITPVGSVICVIINK